MDDEGRTPLHYAALHDNAEEVLALVGRGAAPSAADRRGFTPLHFACENGAISAARVLLDSGADVDSLNEYGNTPLAAAVFNSRGWGDLIKLLRARGANPFIANHWGHSPVSLARRIENVDVRQYFSDLPD